MNRVRLGVSSCLLGENVRYDGGHRENRRLTARLAPYCEWIRVCPEFEADMGVPREPVRLVRLDKATRVLGVESREDWTDRLAEFAHRRVAELDRLELDGYVFKARSPSCGARDTPIHDGSGNVVETGSGVFAAAWLSTAPTVPTVTEAELELRDGRLRFFEAVLARWRLRTDLAHADPAVIRETLGPIMARAGLEAGAVEGARSKTRNRELFATIGAPASADLRASSLRRLATPAPGIVEAITSGDDAS